MLLFVWLLHNFLFKSYLYGKKMVMSMVFKIFAKFLAVKTFQAKILLFKMVRLKSLEIKM